MRCNTCGYQTLERIVGGTALACALVVLIAGTAVVIKLAWVQLFH